MCRDVSVCVWGGGFRKDYAACEGQSRLEPRERLRSAHVFLGEKMVIHRNTELSYVDYIKTFLLQKLSSMSD